MKTKNASVALHVEQSISFRMVKFSAFKLISAPSLSNFAVHLPPILRVWNSSKLNIMFFKNLYFFTRGDTNPKTNFGKELE